MPSISMPDGRVDARDGERLDPDPSNPREFRCPECHSRCTRGTTGLEYGHAYRCPNRPPSLPGNGGVTNGD